MSRNIYRSVAFVLFLAPVAANAQTPIPAVALPYGPPPVVTTVASAPVAVTPVAPVTVTTRRYGLFGLRTRTTVTYGAPVAVPVAATVESAYVPPPPPVVRAASVPVVVQP